MGNHSWHPRWCDPAECTADAPDGAGVHLSRPVVVDPVSPEGMLLRLQLMLGVVQPSEPVLVIIDAETVGDPDDRENLTLPLSLRQTRIVRHVLGRLLDQIRS